MYPVFPIHPFSVHPAFWPFTDLSNHRSVQEACNTSLQLSSQTKGRRRHKGEPNRWYLYVFEILEKVIALSLPHGGVTPPSK